MLLHKFHDDSGYLRVAAGLLYAVTENVSDARIFNCLKLPPNHIWKTNDTGMTILVAQSSEGEGFSTLRSSDLLKIIPTAMMARTALAITHLINKGSTVKEMLDYIISQLFKTGDLRLSSRLAS